MEKYAWKAHIKEGSFDEYCRRHDEIWPEMVDVLKSAGIKNYTIWNVGNELFGYYECEKGIEFASKVQSESPIVLVYLFGLFSLNVPVSIPMPDITVYYHLQTFWQFLYV